MTVEIFKGRLFQYGHERRALGVFLQELVRRFDESDELYLVVIEVDANGANIDLLLLSTRVIIVVDIKELTGAIYSTPASIHLQGKENGAWLYQPGEGREAIRLGGARNKSNPYKQVEQNRHHFAEWLCQNGKAINRGVWDKKLALERTRAWVAISPGFDGKADDLLLPWDQIHADQDWFKVTPLSELAWEFHCTTSNAVHFTANELHCLVESLGAEPVTNLSQVLPGRTMLKTTLPPLFHTVQPLEEINGRQNELADLSTWLEDPNTVFLSLEGMGGTGKSTLLRRMAGLPAAEKWQCLLLSSREAQLTPERFLAAVAAEIPDADRANHLIPSVPSLIEMPGENRRHTALQERLEAALDHLERSHTLLILEDFHAQEDTAWVHLFMQMLALRGGRIKCLFSGREHPALIDHPDFALQTPFIICLQGLSQAECSAFLQSRMGSSISNKVSSAIYAKTSGNPYLISLLLPTLRRTGWNDLLASLPLYVSDRDHWFDTLVENLSPDALRIAVKLALVRAPVDSQLIAAFCPDPAAAFSIFNELVDCYIIQRQNPSTDWLLPEPIAEYLEGKQARAEMLDGTLRTAGRAFLLQAQDDLPMNRQVELQYHALDCFHRAGMSDEFPIRLYRKLARGLSTAGFADRAGRVLQIAYERSIKGSNIYQQSTWLVELAEISLLDTNYQAALASIEKAATLLNLETDHPEQTNKPGFLNLCARVHLCRGRIAYHMSQLNLAEKEFLLAKDIAITTHHLKLQTEAVLRLARTARLRGNLPVSRQQFEQALQLPGIRRDKHTYVEILSHLGLIARSESNVAAARASFSSACRIARRARDANAYEINRSLLADLERRQGNYQTAARMFKDCLEISMKMGSGIGIRVNLGQLAECLIQQGKLREALPLLKEAYSRCQQAGDQIGIAWNYRRRGLYLKKKGEIKSGDIWIMKGIHLLEEIGSTLYIDEFKKDLNPEQARLPGFLNVIEDPFF